MTPDVLICIATPEQAIRVWPVVDKWLAKAMVGTVDDLFEPVDLLAGILKNEWSLWIAEVEGLTTAAILTKVTQYPRARVCHIFLVGGKRLKDWWPHFEPAIIAYATEHGCKRIDAGGRDGWPKVAGARRVGGMFVRDL